jgi:hypothetical protein
MFKSIRQKIYQIIAILFLAVQSIVVYPLCATAVSIAQVSSSPAPEQQTTTPTQTPQTQTERQDRTQQPPKMNAEQETAKNTKPYDMDVIKKFDDELYGK